MNKIETTQLFLSESRKFMILIPTK